VLIHDRLKDGRRRPGGPAKNQDSSISAVNGCEPVALSFFAEMLDLDREQDQDKLLGMLD